MSLRSVSFTRAVELVKRRRKEQDERWGTIEQNPHDIATWMELVDEECSEVWHLIDEYDQDGDVREWRLRLTDELVDLVAVSMAALEQFALDDTEEEE